MMNRKPVRDAYEQIRPTQEQKERMLENILSAASDHVPAGKDVPMKRRKMKPVLIVAVIGLMILLMGCAIAAMRLEDMKIGERAYRGEILDSDGNVVKESVIVKDVISLQGITNSPSQLAAKEWFEFEESYDQDWSLVTQADNNGFEAPDAYDAYGVYTQEMIDKVDEIAEKYGLKLAGASADVQDYALDIFFDSLSLKRLHQADAQVDVEYLSGYFYACGNFNLEFLMTLKDETAQWPYEILMSMRYNDKEYMDTVAFSVDRNDYEQWNYTTAEGTDVLVIMGNGIARIFCDREDAFVSVFLYTEYENEADQKVTMSRRDVELVADALDFTVKPQKPDMDAVKEKLAESEAQKAAEQAAYEATRSDDAYAGFIRGRLEALEHPETLLYYLLDVDGNGVEDLMLGHTDSCETVWTIQDGRLNFPGLTDEDWERIDEMWPELEVKPITEFPMDE